MEPASLKLRKALAMKTLSLPQNTSNEVYGQPLRLFFFWNLRRSAGKPVHGKIIDDAATCGISPDTWREAVSKLIQAGVVKSYETGPRGYRVVLKRPERFTWLPTLPTNRYLSLSNRALGVMWALARVANNRTRWAWVRISKIALWLGISRRSVQMGIRELVIRGMIWKQRTGRASRYRLPNPVLPDSIDRRFAHQVREVLRLVSSNPLKTISAALVLADRRGIDTAPVRAHIQAHSNLVPAQVAFKQRFIDLGIHETSALKLVTRWSQRAVTQVFGRIAGARPALRGEDLLHALTDRLMSGRYALE